MTAYLAPVLGNADGRYYQPLRQQQVQQLLAMMISVDLQLPRNEQ